MARFIARPDRNSCRSAANSAVAGRAKQKLPRLQIAGAFRYSCVGPVWSGGNHGEAETLANCYRNSLELALEHKIKTIAFPAISCGAYRYPIADAARIAIKTTRDFLTAMTG